MSDRRVAAEAYLAHELPIDAAVTAGLLVIVYATPARLRPALALGVAIVLSRLHGGDRHRLERTMLRLFDERSSILRQLPAIREQLDRVDDAVDELTVNGVSGYDLERWRRFVEQRGLTDEREELRRSAFVRNTHRHDELGVSPLELDATIRAEDAAQRDRRGERPRRT